MTDVDQTSRFGMPPPSEEDVLLSRLIDGEASAEDREQFDDLAAAEPSLWRRLAAQQQESALLGVVLEEHLGSAMLVELPDDRTHAAAGLAGGDSPVETLRGAGHSMTWLAAMVGWAAVLVLSVVLAISGRGRQAPVLGGTPAGGGDAEGRQFTPEEHWRLYLQAPFVSEELAPMIRESEQLPNGGMRLYIIRRIEETYDLTPDQAAAMFDELDTFMGGELTRQREHLDEIRRSIQQRSGDPNRY